MILYCRNTIYPLGLPNGVSHGLTALALLARLFLRLRASFLPPVPSPLQVSLRSGQISGRFTLLAVTTLEKMLFSGELTRGQPGSLKLIAIDERPLTLIRAFFASVLGKLGNRHVRGVTFEQASEISIQGDRSSVILDGETFRAELGSPIFLKPAQPLSFVRLAA
jgi:hypothetical protein